MRHPSRQRLLIIFAGILLTSIFWTGANHPSPAAAAQQAGQTAGRTPIVLNTKPVRVVADAAPVLSGIAIDTQRDEVFMTNDKESAEPSIMVYPTQFQPTDRVMEPKRRLAGPKTNLALPCGVAVSPGISGNVCGQRRRAGHQYFPDGGRRKFGAIQGHPR